MRARRTVNASDSLTPASVDGTSIRRARTERDASASETIHRIERHQFVERHHRNNDRRVVECRLSVRGEQLVEEIAGVRLEGMRRLLSVLTPAELTEFDRLIRLIGARLDASRSGTGSSPNAPGRCA